MYNVELVDNNGKMYNATTAFTHGGIFHADDVFASALLVLFNPEIEIQRGFKVPENFEGIVYDIGGGEFDHHFEGAPVRPNGVPYSSFGLLWERFGRSLFQTEESFQKVDRELVQPIDLSDCTGEKNPLSLFIGMFNPAWDCQLMPAAAFKQAVNEAKTVLEMFIESARSNERAKETLAKYEANSENGIIVLEKFVPWGELTAKEEPKFVIFPSLRGGWNIQVVPVSYTDKAARIDLPHEWWGNPNISEITDGKVSFCHLNGFIAAVDTKEHAIEICKELVEKSSK